jgi:succinate-semialdehyde dehydrogenase/glutarate-semialdehyde dehydrogenase
VAAFAPWNFPLGNPGRKLAAPIAAGCSVILKAAEKPPPRRWACCNACMTPGCRAMWRRRCSACPRRCRHLLRSPVIRKLSFTGSTAVGKLIKLAAEDLKRTTMELGGMARCWCLPMPISIRARTPW